MYKYANRMLPPIMNELFIVNSTIHEHNSRQSHMLHTNRRCTDISYRSFHNVGPRIWNALLNKFGVMSLYPNFKK